MKCFSAAYIQYLWDEIGQVIESRKLGPINQVKVDNESNSQSGSHFIKQSVSQSFYSFIYKDINRDMGYTIIIITEGLGDNKLHVK